MNYITSCPACETQFLLTKDHLKAYRGKVQCGHCSHVFNAKNRLIEVSDDVQSVADYTAAEYTDDLDSEDDLAETLDSDIEVSRPEPTEPDHLVDEKPISQVLNVVLETVPNLTDLSTQNEPENNQEPDGPYISNQIPESIAEDEIDIDAVRAPIFIDDLTTDPKFKLNKPKLNIWLILAALLLIIVALLQSIYFLRSTIAVNYPQFKPYLQQACAQLHCKISLPQHLDLLTIDDSDMQESEDYLDVINFSSLLINNAPHAQAYPNIELTLTDIDDKPVLRKLVRPQEYLNSGVNIIDGMTAREEVRINLAINVHNLSVAGYRVLLTY
jgi:predicted Zn finger-like uncharacterized protein